jgi:hypothetical protein
MKSYFLLVIISIVLFSGCNPSYEPHQILSQTEYDSLVLELAPYLNKKPKEASFEERFTGKYKSYYKNLVKQQESYLKYLSQNGSTYYFYYVNKDLTSLYEHYKGFGGYYEKNSEGNIHYLNIIFETPRFTKEEIEKKGNVLFNEMVQKENVLSYLNNREFIKLPNDDFEYDPVQNKWVYTENSSWKFLEEIRRGK